MSITDQELERLRAMNVERVRCIGQINNTTDGSADPLDERVTEIDEETAELLPSLLEDHRRLKKQVDSESCDACGGNGKPISNRPCMCGGSGRMSDAAIYLRNEMIKAQNAAARYTDDVSHLRIENEAMRELLKNAVFRKCMDGREKGLDWFDKKERWENETHQLLVSEIE